MNVFNSFYFLPQIDELFLALGDFLFPASSVNSYVVRLLKSEIAAIPSWLICICFFETVPADTGYAHFSPLCPAQTWRVVIWF